MIEKLVNMLKAFMVLAATIVAIGAGLFGVVYGMINAFWYICIFVAGLAGLGFGLVTLQTIADKLR